MRIFWFEDWELQGQSNCFDLWQYCNSSECGISIEVLGWNFIEKEFSGIVIVVIVVEWVSIVLLLLQVWTKVNTKYFGNCEVETSSCWNDIDWKFDTWFTSEKKSSRSEIDEHGKNFQCGLATEEKWKWYQIWYWQL